MSELKTYKMVDEKYCTDCVCVIPSEVYIKSEADKVIAYRDCEIKKLKDSLNKLLKANTEQIMQEVIQKALIYGDGFVPVEHAIKLVAENRHSKYKRCLAMARWCDAYSVIFQYKVSILDDEHNMRNLYRRKRDRMDRWALRWFKLAKEFKSEYENGRR